MCVFLLEKVGLPSQFAADYTGANALAGVIFGKNSRSTEDVSRLEAGGELTLSWGGGSIGGVLLKRGFPVFKWLRANGGARNGFSISFKRSYGAQPRFDFHRLSNSFNSRATSKMTIPRWLDGKKLPHWHRGKGNNLRYHRPWELTPKGKRKW